MKLPVPSILYPASCPWKSIPRLDIHGSNSNDLAVALRFLYSLNIRIASGETTTIAPFVVSNVKFVSKNSVRRM